MSDQEPRVDPSPESETEARPPAPSAHPPARILVASDDSSVVRRLRKLDAGHGPELEVHACERVAELGTMLEQPPGFDVLVAGEILSGSNGLQRLAMIREELPHLSIVLAFDALPQVSPSELLRAGAVDYLDLQADDDETIHGALHRAAQLHQRMQTESAVAAAAAIDRHGKVFTVASASGGAGKTFIAISLAWYLTHVVGGRTLIIDLDLQFGEVAPALHLQPSYSIADLVRYDEGQWYLSEYFEDFTTVHESGISVLAATRDPSEAWGIKPSDVDRIMVAARQRFDFVIVDTAPTVSEAVVNALHASDEVLVVATADVPSIRNMRVFLETIERFDVPSDHVKLLLNKAEKGLGLDPQVVQRLFPQGFEATIPYSRDVSRALNAGDSVLRSNAHAPVSKALASCFGKLVGDHVTQHVVQAGTEKPDGAAKPARGVFRRKAR